MSNQDQLSAIRASFQTYFEQPDLVLPSDIPAKGKLSEGGWHVEYLLDKTEDGEPFLDFFAENRQTNSRHVRIHADGSTEALENYQTALVFPEGEDDWDRAAETRAIHNQRVTEILRAKGFQIKD